MFFEFVRYIAIDFFVKNILNLKLIHSELCFYRLRILKKRLHHHNDVVSKAKIE